MLDLDHFYPIVTPEQVTLDYELAGIGSRSIAAIIDTAILLIVDLLFTIWIIFVGAQGKTSLLPAIHQQMISQDYALAIYIAIIFFFTLLYYILFEGLWSGRTPGKWLTRLRVISIDGRPLSFFASVVRNLVRIVDLLPSGYLIGMVFMLVTKREQRLGDLAAGTIVILNRKTVSPLTRRSRKRASKLMQATRTIPLSEHSQRLAQLCPDRLQEVILTFTERAIQLRPARADELARTILAALLESTPHLTAETVAYAHTKPAVQILSEVRAVLENDPQT